MSLPSSRAWRWLILAVPACVYVPLESSPYQDVDRDFAAGAATRAEIVDALGPPNVEAHEYRFVLYEWESDGAYVAHPALAVMACHSPVAGVSGFTRDMLLMEFDDEGLLIRSAVVRNPRYGRKALIRRFENDESLVPDEDV